MSWQWNNLSRLDSWLNTDPSENDRQAVLEAMATWLEELNAREIRSGTEALSGEVRGGRNRASAQRSAGHQIIVAIVVAEFRTLYLTAIIDLA